MAASRRGYENLAQEEVSIDADIIATMLTRIYRGKYGNDGTKSLDRGLFEATHETFNRATASGIADAVNRGIQPPSAHFLELLDRNNAIFSAFRSNKFQKDVASMLLDSEGRTKSFADFKRDVAPIVGKYNGSWLRTEYATAVQRSRLATKWQQFVDEQDVFPNLEWVQSTALHPGEDHRIFWYTVRPVDDPFWTHHRPGDRWNCQCDLRQTNLPPTDIPTVPINDTKNSPAPGLDNNPGTDGQIFNDRHPYFPKNCTACTFANVGKKLMALAGIKVKNCKTCQLIEDTISGEVYERKTFKSGGYVEYPTIEKQNKGEEEGNMNVLTWLAKYHGEQYRLLPVKNKHGKPNPDALNKKTNVKADVKEPKTPNGKNAIQNSISSASHQEVKEVIIHLKKSYTKSELFAGLRAALQPGRAKTIETVIIMFNNKEIKRYDTAKFREMLYKKNEKE